jgi:hypothetical protein
MLRRYIESLGPYQSLVLLALPTALVEPLKIVAIAIAGAGHWLAGTLTLACAYTASLLVVERLFKIAKPKLLTLPWFARLWNWFVERRDQVVGRLTLSSYFESLHDPLECRVHPVLDFNSIGHRTVRQMPVTLVRQKAIQTRTGKRLGRTVSVWNGQRVDAT